MKRRNIIYALLDPVSNEIRYIGKSEKGIFRTREHLKPSNLKASTHKVNWIKSLIEKGLEPNHTVIHELDTHIDLDLWEKYYIAFYRAKGCNLTNATDGGEGSHGRVLSDETKQKLSLLQKKYHEEYKNKYGPKIAYNRKHHILVVEVESKQCTDCNKIKPLEDYHKHKDYWDGLNRVCKECNLIRKAEYDKANRELLSEEDWKKSYETRKESMRAGVKKAYENNPDLKANISKARSKAIKAVHQITGEVLRFKSALEAKSHGFHNSNVGQAIKFNAPYKGYIWSFDNN